ncbi:helix-turn-helix transcriptional regulator [Rathayibacter caricis]|uniref:helix-turn-helix transcriptional regulator n=1 Tax=Rathayibacter caricis TaxID=110936 RepID=UPI0027E0D488|nr:helix-turn-helix transcriptional regulator [Rathayibacter caricis]
MGLDPVDPAALDPPAQPDGLDVAELSAREREVLHLITLGASDQQMADDLGISANTAKFRVSNLLRKAGASNHAELAALAR